MEGLKLLEGFEVVAALRVVWRRIVAAGDRNEYIEWCGSKVSCCCRS